MIDVALCIGTDHDPILVLVAVFVCCLGSFAIMQMFGLAGHSGGPQRIAWLFLTAVGAGATIWCTHFVAMLAYQAGVPVQLDPVLTIVSLIIAILGTGAGFGFAALHRDMPHSLIGGGIVGLAIAAMHFTGMAAYRVDGIVEWRMPYVAAAILCSVVFASAALAAVASERLGRHRVAAATGLLVLAIAALHFVGMTALRITPLSLSESPLDAREMQALGLATAVVGLLVIAGGVFAALLDRWARTDAMQQLHHMAMHDSLTGLPNRAMFQDELKRRMAIARVKGTHLGVIAMDLNRFKEINDLRGHKAGDEVLIEIARRMAHQIAGSEFVARVGGDEFVALTGFDRRYRLDSLLGRLKVAIEAPIELEGFETSVGCSIGVAVFPQDAGDAQTLANNADLAMYRAKSQRSLTPCHYDAPLDEIIRDRRELANDLRLAIEKNQLQLHYQVQASITTEDVTGYEALLRWKHPERGNISPVLFIPIAEENGLIVQLGEWVMRRACSDAMGWEHQARVAVNVSPVQLAYAELPAQIRQILLDTGLPPRRLEIELTESAIMANRERALHVLRQIKAMGIGVALDDFGTGYSSLETLRAFPFDKIKLDRMFVSELEDSVQAVAIIRAVLALGRSLSIRVLAEGIETESQLGVLQREGCDEVQGFLLGYPQAEASYDRSARGGTRPSAAPAPPDISDAA
jgi:diguanylate cyclase